ncbi:protein of unknown function (plasmid) [Streptantibioticus cattleyicolor NRRL 8057 = DSM 46488]|nr:protein of unknown function [Streptantibioticus cattleyicolor NRRL 8057 = DSM 46488]
MARTRAASRPSSVTIGYTKGLIITPAVRALRDRDPGAEVNTRLLAWNDSRGALLEHRVDAVVTRLLFPTGQLRVTVLYDEPRVLIVARDHRLAGKESVTLDDIVDEPIPRVRRSDPLLNAYWRLDPRPDGRPAPDGPLLEALEDEHELIAAGQAVAIGPPPRLRDRAASQPHHGPVARGRTEPGRARHPRRRPQPSGHRFPQTRRSSAHRNPPDRTGTHNMIRGGSARPPTRAITARA